MKQNKIYIYGRHPVGEALRHAPHVLRKILLSKRMDDKKLLDDIKRSGIPVEPLDERKATSQVEGGAMHQGIIALISLPALTTPFENFFETFVPTKDTSLVLLSEIQDPHNVGAIIRSAVAFGASAVLIPQYKQSPVTGSAIKASAGMAFRIPLISVENVQQAVALLKKKGVTVYGLAAGVKNSVAEESFATASLFMLGNEGQGLSPAAKSVCDQILSIPISPRAESLNVAASAAVVLYAWSLTHPNLLKP